MAQAGVQVSRLAPASVSEFDVLTTFYNSDRENHARYPTI